MVLVSPGQSPFAETLHVGLDGGERELGNQKARGLEVVKSQGLQVLDFLLVPQLQFCWSKAREGEGRGTVEFGEEVEARVGVEGAGQAGGLGFVLGVDVDVVDVFGLGRVVRVGGLVVDVDGEVGTGVRVGVSELVFLCLLQVNVVE